MIFQVPTVSGILLCNSFSVSLKIIQMLGEDTETSQRGEGCSMAKEGGPFSFITSPQVHM